MLLPASGGRGWQTSNKFKYPYGWLITGNKTLTDQETTDHEVNIFVKVVYYEDRFLFQKPVTQFQNYLNLSIWWWGENVSLQLDLEAVTQFSNLWVSRTVIFMHLILPTLTSVCIFSILLFIHFLICWQGKQDLVRRNWTLITLKGSKG